MKLRAALLSSLLVLQMAAASLPALAEISFAGEAISGKAPVNKVGNLLLSEGVAVLTATTIEIQAKGPDGHETSQLTGQVLKATRQNGKINGTAFFDHGPSLGTLDGAKCDEFIRMTDGTKVPGPITDVTPSSITAGRRTIPMSEVGDIHSVRAFKFSVTPDAKSPLTFEPTCVKGAVVHVKSSSSSDIPYKKIVIIGVIGAVIATAIAVPIAVPQAVRRHHHHHNNNANYNRAVYGRNSSSSSSSFSSSQGSSQFNSSSGGGSLPGPPVGPPGGGGGIGG